MKHIVEDIDWDYDDLQGPPDDRRLLELFYGKMYCKIHEMVRYGVDFNNITVEDLLKNIDKRLVELERSID